MLQKRSRMPFYPGGEQTYDNIRKLQADAAELRKGVHALTSTIPAESGPADVLPLLYHHPNLCDKIKSTCRIAREAGFRLVWIDSCCIDKTSSAELSEAINSMYEWYRLSDICYVYLEDVPEGDLLDSKDSRFHTSRWHKRGWTLQELVAPERVVFVTETWSFLGTKIGLAHVLECITGIEFDILTHRAPLESVSVARRMSWNADRQTTRVEDRAYSLMGLFGVHMSPIYGEGHNAFLRLQEEIIRTVLDQSIFTWGRGCTLRSLSRTRPSHKSSIGRAGFHGLLAQSPDDFRDYGGVSVISSAVFASRLGLANEDRIPPLHCIFTPEGVQAQFLCVDLSHIPQLFKTFFAEVPMEVCESCMRLGHAHALALLQCEDVDEYLLALPICHSRRSLEPEVGLGLTIETHISCDDENVDHRPFHTIGLTRYALEEALKHLSTDPVEVSLLRHYSPPPIPKSRQIDFALQRGINFWPKDRANEVTFIVPPDCIENLNALGFAVSPLRYEPIERSGEIIVSLTLLSVPEHRLWVMGPQQSIHIRISLTLLEPKTRVPHWDVKTRFSVTNRIGVLSEASLIPADSTSTASSDAVPPLPNSLPCVVEGSTRKDDHDTFRMKETHSESQFRSRWSTERTLASAEFVLHADTKWEADLISRRLLRLSLERSQESATWNMCKDVCIVVDLSDAYPHRMRRNPETSDDGSSDGVQDSETDNGVDGEGSLIPSGDLGRAASSPQALHELSNAVAIIPQTGGTRDAIASSATPSELVEIARNKLVEPTVNPSPRTLPQQTPSSTPFALQQTDGTRLPLISDRSSGTSAPGACNVAPWAISRENRGDSGVSSMLSSTAMAMSCGRISLAQAIPAASSSHSRQDNTQAAKSCEAVTPYIGMQDENPALHAALASQNTILSSRITEMSSQMDTILARLDTVTSGLSQDVVEERRAGLHCEDIFSRNPRKKRPQCIVM